MPLTESQQRLLALFDEVDKPHLTAPQVAERFGISQQSAHDRLERLHDRGELEKEQVGARAVVWWRADQSDSASC